MLFITARTSTRRAIAIAARRRDLRALFRGAGSTAVARAQRSDSNHFTMTIPKTGDVALDDVLQQLAAVAERRGLTIDTSRAASDKNKQSLSKGLGGAPLPPGYARALDALGFVRVVDGEERELLRLLPFSDVKKDTLGLVFVPDGVSWESSRGEKHVITTNHLLAFAVENRDPEARWCFSRLDPTGDDELGIYWHHQDEPTAARIAATGERLEPDREPDARSFTDWLRERVKRMDGAT
jgi:hypothetical protein